MNLCNTCIRLSDDPHADSANAGFAVRIAFSASFNLDIISSGPLIPVNNAIDVHLITSGTDSGIPDA